MKIIDKMLLCPFILISATMAESSPENYFVGPPGSHVKNASIHLDYTKTIYANGRMQAPIRIHHELASGVELKSINLKNMYYGDDINPLDWKVSKDDAGFDKVIGYSNVKQVYPINTAQNTILYVSANRQKANTIANICLELVTTLDNQEKSYSTCYDEGIANGFVSIHAIPEIKYGPKEFFLEGKGVLSGGLYEEMHHVVLKKGNSIPRNITFKVEEGIPHIDKDILWLDNSHSSLNYWVKGSRFRSNISSFITKADEEIAFNWVWSPLYPGKSHFNIPIQNEPDTLFNVIVYYLHQFEFISQDKRCVQVNNSCNYKCISQYTLETSCQNFVETQNVESQNIFLLDNYGNEARFTFALNPENGEPHLK